MADRPDRRPGRRVGASGQAELVGIHVVEIDWTLPLDADVAGRSEDAQRVLDIAEATAEAGQYKLETVLLQARDVGAASSTRRPSAPPTWSSLGLPFRRSSAETSPSEGRFRTS